MKSGKYMDLWIKHRQFIKDRLEISETKQSIQLKSENFQAVGNRKDYSFNLEYINGIVSNNVSGSAVARDLSKILDNSDEIKKILMKGHYKINMDKQFCLWIKKIN